MVWGPKTLKVMVPVALVPDEPARVEVRLVVMVAPAASVAGPTVVNVGEALPTTVSDIVAPQVEVAATLLASPP